jgi:membrane-associated phospholipid phosphatase
MAPKRFAAAFVAVVALAVPANASAGVVTDWNRAMVDALVTARTAPFPGTRIGAIVQTSVFDAVNGITGRYTQIHPEVIHATPLQGASRDAAAAGAAYTALVALFPLQQPAFDAQLATTLAGLHASPEAVARGLAWGQTVANAILAWRSTDGIDAPLPPYQVLPLPSWQPTLPLFAGPIARQFASMTPWAMSSPSQFLPPRPPALTSHQYAHDFNEVKALGSVNSSVRTPEQTLIAQFWGLGANTVATYYNRTAESLVAQRHISVTDSARLFALLNMAEADAVIAVWNAKNHYNTWRPITAIENADVDGNDATAPEVGWRPLLPTPPFQEYPSGHSGVSSAAVTVLAAFFGDQTTFTIVSDGVPGAAITERTYTSFSAAIQEVGLARMVAGIHFRFACDAAIAMGAGVGQNVLATQTLPLHG